MSQEVRLAVQRALDKLINRFGSQADVIAELRNALALMDKTGDATDSAKPAAESVATPVQRDEPETTTEEPVYHREKVEVTGEKAKPSPKARKSTGRKK